MNHPTSEELMTKLRLASEILRLRVADLMAETQRAGRIRFDPTDLLRLPSTELKEFFERQEIALDRRQVAIDEAVTISRNAIQACTQVRDRSNEK